MGSSVFRWDGYFLIGMMAAGRARRRGSHNIAVAESDLAIPESDLAIPERDLGIAICVSRAIAVLKLWN
jgi:hypothetical protein